MNKEQFKTWVVGWTALGGDYESMCNEVDKMVAHEIFTHKGQLEDTNSVDEFVPIEVKPVFLKPTTDLEQRTAKFLGAK